MLRLVSYFEEKQDIYFQSIFPKILINYSNFTAEKPGRYLLDQG